MGLHSIGRIFGATPILRGGNHALPASTLPRVLLWAVTILFAIPSGAALPPHFTRISVEQGLSQSTVETSLQDQRGFLWFGTDEGLNRFDGYSFALFKNDPKDPQSLPDNKISALLQDDQGRLWVGTWKGLSLFDYAKGNFSMIPEIHSEVTALLEMMPDGSG